jgi:hypothetical protein
MTPTPAPLPQRLVVEKEAVLHGVPRCRIGASSLRGYMPRNSPLSIKLTRRERSELNPQENIWDEI